MQYVASAQDFSSFYSYMLNRVNINSALVGSTNSVVALMDYRSQYNGIPGGPRNLMFCLHSPIGINQGAGLKVIQDSRGAFSVTRADAMYSHRVQLADSISIRFGLSVGFISRQLNTNGIGVGSNMFDLSDPTLSGSNYNYTRFISGFGMVLNLKQLEIGFSAPQIIQNSESIGQYLVGTLAYKYKFVNSKWDVQPFAIYQNLPVTKKLLDVAVRASWDSKLILMGGYANNNTLKASVGIQMSGFGVSYLYEHPTGYRKNLSNGTHEILLSVSIKRNPKRLTAVKMEKDLNAIMNYMNELMRDDANYSKDYIKSELERINKQLNEIMAENSEKNAGKVADKLDKIEEQINYLISKYKL